MPKSGVEPRRLREVHQQQASAVVPLHSGMTLPGSKETHLADPDPCHTISGISNWEPTCVM